MMNEQTLIEKLLRIEALYAGATSVGERDAAANARDRIKARLKEAQKNDPPVEYKFGLPNMWSKKLFMALLHRYDLKPYRYYRQKHTTVMVHVSKSFVDETLWPEFQKLNELLNAYLEDITERIISEAIYAGNSEEDVRSESAKQIG